MPQPPPGYGMQPPAWGPPPPAKRSTSPVVVILALALLGLAGMCVFGMVLKNREDAAAARQRVAEAAERARQARIAHERFVSLGAAEHLAAARLELPPNGPIADSVLTDARQHLSAIPANAGMAAEVAALTRLIDRRAAENEAERARQAAEAERARRRLEETAGGRQAYIDHFNDVGGEIGLHASSSGPGGTVLEIGGLRCTPQSNWHFARHNRREFSRVGFTEVRCHDVTNDAVVVQPLPAPSRFVEP